MCYLLLALAFIGCHTEVASELPSGDILEVSTGSLELHAEPGKRDIGAVTVTNKADQ
jgi:hypothetical protein